MPVGARVEARATHHGPDFDAVARQQSAQLVQGKSQFDEIGVLLAGSRFALRRAVELLQSRARQVADFRVQPENALADVERQIRTHKIAVLRIREFVAQNAAHRRREIGEGQIRQKIQAIGPLPVRVQDAVPDAHHVGDAGQTR